MGQAEGVAQLMDGPFEKELPIEARHQAEVGTDLTRNGVVVDHRPAAVRGISSPGKVVEPGGPVTNVNEDPPYIAFSRHSVFLRRPIDYVLRIIRLGIFAARHRLL